MLGLSYAMVHDFAAALQGVAAAGVGVALPSPLTSAPLERVVTL